MHLEVVDITDVSTEPVTLAEARKWCKVTITDADEDALINLLITSARIALEKYLGICIPSRKLKATWSCHYGSVSLPYPPVIEITKVADVNGDTETDLVAGTGYVVIGTTYPQIMIYEVITSSGYTQRHIIAEYTAGYATVPELLKHAILKQVVTDYYNREDTSLGAYAQSSHRLTSEVKKMVQGLKQITTI